MKTIKPAGVAVLTRTVEFRQRFRFVATPMLYVSFDHRPRLKSEAALWTMLAEQLGPNAVFDAGMPKGSGEFVVHARATPPGGRAAPWCAVRSSFAGVEKDLLVFGERRWQGQEPSEPLPFTELSLGWEQAFGGEGFAANPLGIGFARPAAANDPWLLPRIEDPSDPTARPGVPIRPGGFGPRGDTHPARTARLGTHDDAWLKTDYPGLPRDTDWTFFNVAAEDQWLPLPLRPDARFEFRNLHPAETVLRGALPGLMPRCFVTRLVADEPRLEPIETPLETVHFFPHLRAAVLVCRGSVEVAEDDASEIKLFLAAVDWHDAPRPLAHFADAVQRRLDPENGHFLMLKEDDLLPSGRGERYDADPFTDVPIADPRPLLTENLKRRQRAEVEAARAQVAAYGIDPDDGHAPPLPVDPPALPATLEQLPAYLERVRADGEAKKKELEALDARFEHERRSVVERVGLDYSVVEREMAGRPKGPPKPVEKPQMQALSALRATVAAGSGPVDEIDQYLLDPEFQKRLRDSDRHAKAAYRATAHLQDAADRMSSERAAWVRERAIAHWQSGSSFRGIDLTGADLSGLSFAGADFGSAHLEGVDFRSADLSGATFDKAVLARADLRKAKLAGANLEEANLGRARLDDATFDDARLAQAILVGATLARATFARADLKRAQFSKETDFREADLSASDAADLVLLDADLSGIALRGTCLDRAAFVRCAMRGADLSHASLERAAFIEVDAAESRFHGARLVKTAFVGANRLERADFREATIQSCNFRPAALAGARFRGAQIDGSDFSATDLSDADFGGAAAIDTLFVKADLRRAVLAGGKWLRSSFAGARLEGADVREAQLYGADFARVAADTRTRFDGAKTEKLRRLPERRDDGRAA